MPTIDKKVLADNLRKLSAVLTDMADQLTAEPKEAAPAAEVHETHTYEETRAILAEKARTGFRAEVKAILTSHGVKQLSEVKDPELFAAIIAEAEVLGNA